MEKSDKLKEILLKNNLTTFGITSDFDFSYLYEKFNQKTELNFFSDFDNFSFEKRSIISSNYPNCKSIISIAFPYPILKNTYSDVLSKHGYLISSYALINDYHLIIQNILSNITKQLISHYPNGYFKILSDSNPLFEKEIAKKCGIGNYGKNSLLYNKKYGSHFFLAEILTDIHFESYNLNEAQEMPCDNCNLCKTSCPNNAIQNNMINGKKCISALTASKKFFYPHLIKNHLWGCDICQNVCPINKNLLLSEFYTYFTASKVPTPSLFEILSFSNKELSKLYSEFPIGWSGYSVLKRNALFILYNQKNPDFVIELEKIKKKSPEGVLKEVISYF